MSVLLRRLAVIVFIAYLLLTCYTAYFLISKNTNASKKDVQRFWALSGEEEWNPWGEELEKENKRAKGSVSSSEKPKLKWWSNHSLDFGKTFQKVSSGASEHNVEVWGKSAVGLYLWEHVLGGKVEKKMNGIWSYGFKKLDNIKFKFRTGPGVIPSKVPSSVEYLVLTLNGRSEEKVEFSKFWLDFLSSFRNLKGVAVLILGNEQCENEWLVPYMESSGGIINFTFIIYDTPLIDNNYFFQWPLGVAMYRNFPKIDLRHLDLEEPRPYMCNFLGTVYTNSSREKMMSVLESSGFIKQCLIKTRSEWLPNETKESMEAYVSALTLSDLTLSPVGKNTECYRIYEAMSVGSVPVVEDIETPGSCGDGATYRGSIVSTRAPLRLLKTFEAPIIYLSDWSELPGILQKEALLSPAEKIRRRRNTVTWYEDFKLKLRDHFVSTLKWKFFKEKR